MRVCFVVVVGCVLVVSALAQSVPAVPATQPGLSFSVDNIDKAVNPCTDFYQYACGNWLKNSEIPLDQTRWLSFLQLNERNQGILREILEKTSADSPTRSAIDQKIGDFYGACMDENAADAKGLDPLKLELARIAAVSDRKTFIEALAHDHLIGADALFAFGASPDLHNADKDIAELDQGGLTLPDRDYYIQDTPHMIEIRKHLVDYVTQVFTLEGQSAQQAAESAQSVLRIETALAKAAMDAPFAAIPRTKITKRTRMPHSC